jgi:hypothetical protein
MCFLHSVVHDELTRAATEKNLSAAAKTDVAAGIGWSLAQAATWESAMGTSDGFFYVFHGGFQTWAIYLNANGNTPGTLEWWVRGGFGLDLFITDLHTEPDVIHDVETKMDDVTKDLSIQIDGQDFGVITSSSNGSASIFGVGARDSLLVPGSATDVYITYLKIGSTGVYGSSNRFSKDFSTDCDFSGMDLEDVSPGAELDFTDLFPPTPPTPGLAPCQSPMWRFVATDLDSNVTTILDRIASNRHVEPLLGVPSWLAFDVPSDSPLVNIPFPDPDDDPYVAEGVRLVYAFRQESYEPPYFTCRAAGTVLQVQDSAQQDVAQTRVTAFDSWKLAYFRPAQNADGELPSQITPLPPGYWDGVYPPGTTGGEIVLDQLLNTIVNNGPLRADAGAAYGGTGFYDGTIEATLALTDGFTVQQGMSVGDVWAAMVNTFTLDIVLEPIYDPVNRPGYTHQLNIYVEAGEEKPAQILSWDTVPHSVVALQRMIDGTQRANKVLMAAGQGGSEGKMAAPATDATSVSKYGQYWAQQYLPGSLILDAVEDMADFQLSLRKNGRTTVQISPAPERSPCPFVEYNLGDRLPVYATGENFRQVLTGFVRVYGIPIDISDDALESVTGMVLLPPSA